MDKTPSPYSRLAEQREQVRQEIISFLIYTTSHVLSPRVHFLKFTLSEMFCVNTLSRHNTTSLGISIDSSLQVVYLGEKKCFNICLCYVTTYI